MSIFSKLPRIIRGRLGDQGAFEEPKTLDDLRLFLERQERTATERARESDARLLALENQQPNNAYRRKVKDGHHHEQTVEGFDDDAGLGFGYQINWRYGLSAARDSWPTNLRFDVDAVGVGMCYDHIVMPGWAGTEGHQFLKFDQVTTFRIWSTLQGAMTQVDSDGATSAILYCGRTTENVAWDPGSGPSNFSMIIHGLGATGGNPKSELTGNFLHQGFPGTSEYLLLQDFAISGDFTATNASGDQVIMRDMTISGDTNLAADDFYAENSWFVDIVLTSIRIRERFVNCIATDINGDASASITRQFRWKGGRIKGSVSLRDASDVYIDTLWDGSGLSQDWYVKIMSSQPAQVRNNITLKGLMLTMTANSSVKDYVLFADQGTTRAYRNVTTDLTCERLTDTTFEAHYFRNAQGIAIHAANIRINCGVATDFSRLEDMAGGYASVKGVFAQSTFMLTPCDAEVDLTGSVAGDNCIITGSDTQDLAGPTGSDIELPFITGATYTDVEDMNTLFHSAGHLDGGAISDSDNQQIDVAAGRGAIRIDTNSLAQLKFFDWAGVVNQDITVDTIRYVGVEYNNGSPQVVIRTSENWNLTTDFPLGEVTREGSNLHITNAPWRVGDHARFMAERMHATNHIARDNFAGGLIFGETGARFVTVTSGTFWVGLTSFAINSINTNNGDDFDTYSSKAASDGLEATGVSQWPNAQYDNGGALANLGTNKWANLWWYLELDGGLVMVYGTAQYATQAQAEAETPPTTIPNRLHNHGTLSSRFIFQEGAATAAQILSPFITMFLATGVTSHGDLADIGGGEDDHPEYALVDGTRGVSEHTYVFVPDAAKGADITVSDQQGILHHSGDQEETVTATYLDAETAPTGASLIIEIEYGDTDDLDTVGSWTIIDTVTLTATNKSVKDSTPTQATLPANRLIRLNVTQVGSTLTGADAAVHMKVKRKLTT